METNKIIERIVKELSKDETAQSIIDTCEQDLLEYYYWEYKELEWERIGLLKKANAHLEIALDIMHEQDEIINGFMIKDIEDHKAFVDSIVIAYELGAEQAREEMLLNIKEQYGISSS